MAFMKDKHLFDFKGLVFTEDEVCIQHGCVLFACY